MNTNLTPSEKRQLTKDIVNQLNYIDDLKKYLSQPDKYGRCFLHGQIIKPFDLMIAMSELRAMQLKRYGK